MTAGKWLGGVEQENDTVGKFTSGFWSPIRRKGGQAGSLFTIEVERE